MQFHQQAVVKGKSASGNISSVMLEVAGSARMFILSKPNASKKTTVLILTHSDSSVLSNTVFSCRSKILGSFKMWCLKSMEKIS
jgi:hypothetical protein